MKRVGYGSEGRYEEEKEFSLIGQGRKV